MFSIETNTLYYDMKAITKLMSV